MIDFISAAVVVAFFLIVAVNCVAIGILGVVIAMFAADVAADRGNR